MGDGELLGTLVVNLGFSTISRPGAQRDSMFDGPEGQKHNLVTQRSLELVQLRAHPKVTAWRPGEWHRSHLRPWLLPLLNQIPVVYARDYWQLGTPKDPCACKQKADLGEMCSPKTEGHTSVPFALPAP